MVEHDGGEIKLKIPYSKLKNKKLGIVKDHLEDGIKMLEKIDPDLVCLEEFKKALKLLKDI